MEENTPLEINRNRRIEKKHHLNQTSITLGSTGQFSGVYVIFWPNNHHRPLYKTGQRLMAMG